MFAKLFNKKDVFDPAALTTLPTLEQSQQLVLLDQYLSYCKSHQQTGVDETALHELLLDLPESAAAAEGISLEIAKRAMSALQDITTLATLLEHPNLSALAAKRLCKLLPLDSDHAVNQHERLFQARLQSANAADIQVLSERVTTAEQAAWLIIRAPAETKAKLLAMAVLQDEVGLTTLERISRGKDKGCNRLAREGLDKIRGCRRLLKEHLKALDDVHSSAQRELKMAPKDLEGLIIQLSLIHI